MHDPLIDALSNSVSIHPHISITANKDLLPSLMELVDSSAERQVVVRSLQLATCIAEEAATTGNTAAIDALLTAIMRVLHSAAAAVHGLDAADARAVLQPQDRDEFSSTAEQACRFVASVATCDLATADLQRLMTHFLPPLMKLLDCPDPHRHTAARRCAANAIRNLLISRRALVAAAWRVEGMPLLHALAKGKGSERGGVAERCEDALAAMRIKYPAEVAAALRDAKGAGFHIGVLFGVVVGVFQSTVTWLSLRALDWLWWVVAQLLSAADVVGGARFVASLAFWFWLLGFVSGFAWA